MSVLLSLFLVLRSFVLDHCQGRHRLLHVSLKSKTDRKKKDSLRLWASLMTAVSQLLVLKSSFMSRMCEGTIIGMRNATFNGCI